MRLNRRVSLPLVIFIWLGQLGLALGQDTLQTNHLTLDDSITKVNPDLAKALAWSEQYQRAMMVSAYETALRYSDSALFYMHQANLPDRMAWELAYKGFIFWHIKQEPQTKVWLDSAVANLSGHESLETPHTAHTLILVGYCYEIMEEYSMAIEYYQKSFEYISPEMDQAYYRANFGLADSYKALRLVAESRTYYRKALRSSFAQKDTMALTEAYFNFTNTFVTDLNLDSLEYHYDKVLTLAEQLGHTSIICHIYANLAKAYYDLEVYPEKQRELAEKSVALFPDPTGVLYRYKLVLIYLRQNLIEEAKPHVEVLESQYQAFYQDMLHHGVQHKEYLMTLTEYYAVTGDTAKAFKYQLELVKVNDEISVEEKAIQQVQADEQAKLQVAQQEVALMEAQQERNRLQLRGGLLVGGLLLVGLGLFIRQRQQNQKSRLQTRLLASELKALRAQINPHFIFNVLAGIQRFVLNHEREPANHYLTKFSHYIRQVLYQSEKHTNHLDEELEMLSRYLEIEQLRLPFAYRTDIPAGVDLAAIPFPSMLLQTFAENAIWHGLAPKTDPGQITLRFREQETGRYVLHLEDNGVGRNHQPGKANHQSKGLRMVEDKMALFNRSQAYHIGFHFEDLNDGEGKPMGTRVVITLQTR